MLNQQCTMIPSVESYIEPLLRCVVTTEKLGMCYGAVKVESVSRSCDKAVEDRFKLSIPYARQSLTWNVFFDSQCPEIGPDFLFYDDTFLADMDIDTISNKVPSLAQWNPNDRNALVNVLIELLSCYKEYQIQLLQKQHRLQLEYNMLVRSTEIKSEDVEVILLPSSAKPTEAKFLINLSVDVSNLPITVPKSGSNVAMLLVTFCGMDWNRITRQFFPSKFLEEILGGSNTLHLPSFSTDSCLGDYVPEVKNFIAGKINSFVQSLVKRREFLATLLTSLRQNLLEYDSTNYTYISFLINDQGFYFVLHVKITLGFPREQPIIVFQSVYHMTNEGHLYTETIEQQAHEPVYLVNNFHKIIKTHIMKFKYNSMTPWSSYVK